MTLIKKFLTASLPVALVGAMTPTIVSCSCSKKSFTFNYKDHINCRDKSDGDYHKKKDIANAVREKAYREQRSEHFDISDAKNQLLKNVEEGGQFAFNDLIASIVITADDTINLNNWDYKINQAEETATLQCDLVCENIEIHSGTINDFTYIYQNDDDIKHVYIQLNNTYKLRSYAFYDCTTN